jgi:hypothetical protein
MFGIACAAGDSWVFHRLSLLQTIVDDTDGDEPYIMNFFCEWEDSMSSRGFLLPAFI